MAIKMITPQERVEEQRKNAELLAAAKHKELEQMSAIQYFFYTYKGPGEFK
jgi:hypothetical protein